MSEQSPPANSVTPAIRMIGRALAIASHGPSVEALKEPGLDLGRLTAGLDPDAVDRESAAYRFGASDAFSAVYSSLAEQMLSKSSLDMLQRGPRGRILVAVAVQPGVPQNALAEAADAKASNMTVYLKQLAAAGLIEPAVPTSGRGKGWRLSPWGAQSLIAASYLLAQTIPEDKLTPALQEALRQQNQGRSSSRQPDLAIGDSPAS